MSLLTGMAAVDKINSWKASGEFHHATFRQQGARSDLYVYLKKTNGFNGFDLAKLSLSSWDEPSVWESAQAAVSSTGYSVGSYGRG